MDRPDKSKARLLTQERKLSRFFALNQDGKLADIAVKDEGGKNLQKCDLQW